MNFACFFLAHPVYIYSITVSLYKINLCCFCSRIKIFSVPSHFVQYYQFSISNGFHLQSISKWSNWPEIQPPATKRYVHVTPINGSSYVHIKYSFCITIHMFNDSLFGLAFGLTTLRTNDPSDKWPFGQMTLRTCELTPIISLILSFFL